MEFSSARNGKRLIMHLTESGLNHEDPTFVNLLACGQDIKVLVMMFFLSGNVSLFLSSAPALLLCHLQAPRHGRRSAARISEQDLMSCCEDFVNALERKHDPTGTQCVFSFLLFPLFFIGSSRLTCVVVSFPSRFRVESSDAVSPPQLSFL